MRPIISGSYRLQHDTPKNPVQGAPPPKQTETPSHAGTSSKTTAASVLPLTTTAHPQQTPPTRLPLFDAPQAEKITQAASSFVASANESNKRSLTTKALIESTKPLFNLLQKVERGVEIAYDRRETIKSSPQPRVGTSRSASANDLEKFRQQRDEHQRSGKLATSAAPRPTKH